MIKYYLFFIETSKWIIEFQESYVHKKAVIVSIKEYDSVIPILDLLTFYIWHGLKANADFRWPLIKIADGIINKYTEAELLKRIDSIETKFFYGESNYHNVCCISEPIQVTAEQLEKAKDIFRGNIFSFQEHIKKSLGI